MRLNLTKPIIIFDLETTGLDIINDRIIQISYIKVMPNQEEIRKDYHVNPERAISEDITKLTGISNEDVAEALTFKALAPSLYEDFKGCDFAGFNSNHFDIPMLAEEFYRAGIDFDFQKSRLIDIQTIYHKMERRNLAAAYKFYCGRKMEDDFEAHRADNDTEATYRVMQGMLDMYQPGRQEEEERQLPNDMETLSTFSKNNDNVDFMGRMVWKEVKDKNGRVMLDENGNPIKKEYFNFGKYKGQMVEEVIHRDTGYYGWIMSGDFSNNTKQILTRIRLRGLVNKK
ncbi:MAG: ribonuclease H-like domain-containing protein [Prevotella sp.]|nr:ribonuclease H-like domain-containing protein [Prevotella sp.]